MRASVSVADARMREWKNRRDSFLFIFFLSIGWVPTSHRLAHKNQVLRATWTLSAPLDLSDCPFATLVLS